MGTDADKTTPDSTENKEPANGKKPRPTPGSRYLGIQSAKVWEKRYRKNGTLLYEGFTVDGKPFGAGTLYWPNGHVYQEGIFDIKGLISGREYYPSGVLRFEGAYQICYGYGPNFPRYGSCFGKRGKLIFSGTLTLSFGGVGWPTVVKPENFGPVEQSGAPRIKMFDWEDARKHGTYQGAV